MSVSLQQRASNLLSSRKPVIRTLYRSLLTSAKFFDQNPTLKAIWKRPSELREKNDTHVFYIPSQSFVKEVRRRFREEIPLTNFDLNKAEDLGFIALRSITATQTYFLQQLSNIQENFDLKQTKTPPLVLGSQPTQLKSEESLSNAPTYSSLQNALATETKGFWAIPETYQSIRPGIYLIAHPLQRGYFRNSIILICSHDEHGTTGLVINKRLHPYLLKSLVSRLFQKEKVYNRKKLAPLIRLGGPVKQTWLSALHTNKDLKNSLTVSNGLFLNLNLKLMSSEFFKETSSPSNFRFFFGYCSWKVGQLESEIRAGVWFPASASSDFIFSPSTKQKAFHSWSDMMRSLGGEYSSFVDVPEEFWKLHLKKLEDDDLENDSERELELD